MIAQTTTTSRPTTSATIEQIRPAVARLFGTPSGVFLRADRERIRPMIPKMIPRIETNGRQQNSTEHTSPMTPTTIAAVLVPFASPNGSSDVTAFTAPYCGAGAYCGTGAGAGPCADGTY